MTSDPEAGQVNSFVSLATLGPTGTILAGYRATARQFRPSARDKSLWQALATAAACRYQLISLSRSVVENLFGIAERSQRGCVDLVDCGHVRQITGIESSACVGEACVGRSDLFREPVNDCYHLLATRA